MGSQNNINGIFVWTISVQLADSKVYEHCLSLVVDHYVFRLDVSMYYFYYPVAIKQCSQKLDQVSPHLLAVD